MQKENINIRCVYEKLNANINEVKVGNLIHRVFWTFNLIEINMMEFTDNTLQESFNIIYNNLLINWEIEYLMENSLTNSNLPNFIESYNKTYNILKKIPSVDLTDVTNLKYKEQYNVIKYVVDTHNTHKIWNNKKW